MLPEVPTEPEIPTEPETPTEAETTTEPEIPTESETTIEPEMPNESETVSESESTTQKPPQQIVVEKYVLHIQWGDTPRMISQELYENGMIDSASKFRKYLADNKYAGKLRSGTYTITKGMTYEEIAKMITKNDNQKVKNTCIIAFGVI